MTSKIKFYIIPPYGLCCASWTESLLTSLALAIVNLQLFSNLIERTLKELCSLDLRLSICSSLCLEGLPHPLLLLHAWPRRTEWRRLPWLRLLWTGLGALPAAPCAPTALILWSLSLQLSQPYPHSEIFSNKNCLFPMVGIKSLAHIRYLINVWGIKKKYAKG